MPLAPGTRLGPYEIVDLLGAGGMGEVYRARDPRLGREVAIKVLPQHLGVTPEIRARFEREAKTVSQLNHPNICVLYDVGREGDTDFLVMEIVQGETLAARLSQGPLPTPEVLRLGIQIADALDRAHRAGVVHRDLKPGNVMLSKSGAKLMDFGLARATGMAGPARGSGVTVAALTQSPTVAAPLTAEGSLVGTYQYMSPEQLEGREADERSDVWALGCVLYEMATGRRAFEGRSQASLISSIMASEPPAVSGIIPLSPPALDQVIRACLAKDPDARIQNAHDVVLQLQWIAEGGSQAGVPAPVAARRRGRERIAWVLLALVGLIAVALAAMILSPRPQPKRVIFELTPPPQVGFVDLPRISPDGRYLAFNAGDSTGSPGIWVRALNSIDARRLPGTEGATRPFWSPDSRYLAFFSGGKLRKIDITGGAALALCDAPRGADGSWSPRGVILFDGSTADTIQQVSASGGTPAGAMTLDRSRQETFAAWPQFLPDGRHFLFIAYGRSPEDRTLKVGSLDSKSTKILGPASSRAEYASGRLLYVRQGTLLAQPFDLGGLRLRGDAEPIAEGVEFDPVGSARFSASSEGTLVYRSGGAGAINRLVWVDRAGHRIGTVGDAGLYLAPALSPDETQLAVEAIPPAGIGAQIWIWDLSRDVGSRFTFDDGDAVNPVWSPDGARIAYTLVRGQSNTLRIQSVGGSGADSLPSPPDEERYAYDWSRDGRTIGYFGRSTTNASRRWDVFALTLGDSSRSTPLVTTGFNEFGPAFSPDGRWIAYSSFQSGQPEIYVQAYPGPGGKWRVSTKGGLEPYWRGDGRELYYLSANRSMMSVAIQPGPTPHFGLPEKLFDAHLINDVYIRNRYLPTRDGQKFLLVSPEGDARVGATTVVLNWLGNKRSR